MTLNTSAWMKENGLLWYLTLGLSLPFQTCALPVAPLYVVSLPVATLVAHVYAYISPRRQGQNKVWDTNGEHSFSKMPWLRVIRFDTRLCPTYNAFTDRQTNRLVDGWTIGLKFFLFKCLWIGFNRWCMNGRGNPLCTEQLMSVLPFTYLFFRG